MSDIRRIDQPDIWDAFVKKQPYTLFVQSSRYGDFYRAIGERAWIFGIYNGTELIGGSLAVSTRAKRGNFLYLPYGPINPRPEFFSFLREFGRGFDFIRVSPFLDDSEEYHKLFQEAGFRRAPIHALAETTWLLDVRPSEEHLFAAMNKNHRNLIRRCEREGVTVRISTGEEALARFNVMHNATAARHRFHRFSERYVEKEYRAFAPDHAFVAEAYLPNGDLDSSAIIMLFGTMACYRHGASYNADRRIPTSYLLQWEVIREAKRLGIPLYNFWGIAPEDAKTSHPFYGISHFKRGFGGAPKQLLPCQDLPLSPRYWLNWSIETARRIRRGF
jgi:lipid II:glycine glycyltransferase (peptidoglycan interpeptide bridge formation enzyme)